MCTAPSPFAGPAAPARIDRLRTTWQRAVAAALLALAHAGPASSAPPLTDARPSGALPKVAYTPYSAELQRRFDAALKLAEQKRTAEAIEQFRKLSDEYPQLPEFHNNLAVLYVERGELDKAAAALEAALGGRSSYETIYRNLSNLNARRAAKAYAQALNLDTSKAPGAKLAMITALDGGSDMAGVKVALSDVNPAPAPAPAPALAPAPATKPAAAAPLPVPAKPAPAPAPAPPAPVKTAAPTPAVPAAASAPAASKPAATASAVAAAPATAAPEPKPRTDAEADASVRKALQAWAHAWETKNIESYIAAYAPGFKGAEATAAAWQAARRVRILGKRSIDVGLSNVSVKLGQNQAAVSFTQSYTADQLRLVSRKTLHFEQRDKRWVIVRESAA